MSPLEPVLAAHVALEGSKAAACALNSILVVDDSASQRATLAALLCNWGYQVHTAASGQEALDLYDQNPIGLVISDWMMPGMNGLDLCRKIRARALQCYPYFIMLTSRSDKEDVASGLHAGADDYLAKPIDKTELYARVSAGWRVVKLHDEVQHIASHDSLTGLTNRAQFLSGLGKALSHAQKNKISAGVILLDLDHFKTINDTCGHDCGDEVLVEVANRLKAVVRTGDIVARLGGDEFAITAPALANPTALESIAQRILAALTPSMMAGGEAKKITASLGLARFPDDGSTAATLIKSADLALYDAKARGRNCASRFDQKLAAAVCKHHRVLASIEKALSDDEIVPFYQPIWAAKGGGIAGFEALVRHLHADGTHSLPGLFWQALDDRALCLEIGERVLTHALKTARAWTDQDLDFGRISINVASHQLQQPEFCDRLFNRLATLDLSPDILTIEITEGVILSDGVDSGFQTTMDRLVSHGIGIDLDDFGTGYASLTHLRHFHVDRIKIDRSFVARLPEDGYDLAIIKALVTLAHHLGKTIVAEGVETRAQADFLKAHGCDYLQGFLFSPALPAAQAVELLRKSPQKTPPNLKTPPLLSRARTPI